VRPQPELAAVGSASGASTTGGDTTGGTSSAGAAGTTGGGHVLTGANALTGFGPNDRPACQLTQLTAHTGAECAAASDSGWCYADGACMAMSHTCDHALCATPAFNKLMLAYQLPSWVVCDGAQSSPR